MTEEERPQFSIIIGALVETFGKEASEAMLLGYWLALKDRELKAIENAAIHLLKTSRFMPVPSEIRDQSEAEHDRIVKAIKRKQLSEARDACDQCVPETLQPCTDHEGTIPCFDCRKLHPETCETCQVANAESRAMMRRFIDGLKALPEPRRP